MLVLPIFPFWSRICRPAILLLLSVSVQATSKAPEGANRVDQHVAARIGGIFEEYDAKDRPGYAVGIIENGVITYAKGFGMASIESGVPISPDSVFNVASLSKQFTAACVGILIIRGELSLESQVRKVIPEFPERFGSMQVQHLIYMTSGLPEYYRLGRPDGRNWSDDYFTVKDAIDVVFQQPALHFEPGSKWAYSNTNYQLLAEMVARVSGVPFSEFARREIFEPLGMTHTHVNDDLGRIVRGRVTGYNKRAIGGYRPEVRRAPHYGGSGVFTSVTDLAKWNQSFRDHSLGGDSLTKLLLQTRKFQHEKANDAFGLVLDEYRGRPTVFYSGGDAGFSSYMVRLPEEDISVIVLSNLGEGRAEDRGHAVLDVLFKDDLH